MWIILDSTNLKSKGLLSFFSCHQFHVKIQATDYEDEITLKSKNSYIGFISEIPDYTANLFFTFSNKSIVLEKHEVKVENESKILLNLDNAKFKGTILIYFTNSDLFTYIENSFLEKHKLNKIQYLSKSVDKSLGFYETRKTYKNVLYYSDKKSCKTFYDVNSSTQIDELPKGWEEGYTKAGKQYYVDHNKCTTGWVHPNAQSYIIELGNKLARYKQISESIYYFNHFDIMKFKVTVRRDFLVQSTAYAFLNASKVDLHRTIAITFHGEIGADYGGIMKEFFYICSLELEKDKRLKSLNNILDVKSDFDLSKEDIVEERFDENTGKFIYKPNFTLYSNYTLDKNINNPFYMHKNKGKNFLNDNDFFRYLGIFIGLAFEHKINIGIDFSLGFYENLLNRKFTIRHIQDPEIQKNLLFVLKSNLDEITILDDDGKELKENTKNNYILKKINYYMFESKKNSYDIIRSAFMTVVNHEFCNMFDASDISRILSGEENVTFEKIKKAVIFHDCSELDKEVNYLFNILRRKNEFFLRKFLQFITGSATIPIASIRRDEFKWFLAVLNKKDMLVRASCCSNKFFIGKYENEETFERILVFSIDNTEGFHKA